MTTASRPPTTFPVGPRRCHHLPALEKPSISPKTDGPAVSTKPVGRIFQAAPGESYNVHYDNALRNPWAASQRNASTASL
jgi:hypothetical protein